MSENMNEKYQLIYNKILNGTLTDTILKSVSYQANIQLANEIIAEQEKTIQALKSSKEESETELQATINTLKTELETARVNKVNSDNNKIVLLENTIKNHLATIQKLQSDLNEAGKLRTEYENVKHQVQHLDTYRNEILKANDTIKNLKSEHTIAIQQFEEKVNALTNEINELKTPVPVKNTKVTKKTKNSLVTKPKAKIIKQDLPGLIVKDGGSF